MLGTPRRLAVVVEGLAPRQRTEEQLVKGPPARVARDADGKPTKAAEGFARKQGVDVDELVVQEIDGGEYLVAVRSQEGRPAVEVLAELLPDLVGGLRFQRSMRWNESSNFGMNERAATRMAPAYKSPAWRCDRSPEKAR